MPSKCCVPNCRTGYKSEEKSKKESIPFFPTSNKELLAKWSNAIQRKDYVFAKFSRVCSNHFDESDIIKGYSIFVEGKRKLVFVDLYLCLPFNPKKGCNLSLMQYPAFSEIALPTCPVI
ncbi:putative Cell division protein ftsj [Daphnia magna]|uniref:Putative Cell division protein ftsj n=1 Tax=Daphnia magna TaxID=35525 RepID=A0A164TI83_9CRUS|nr:putative Cell division protein ftsj [Daphnia magna]